MRLSPAQSWRFCGRQFSAGELEFIRRWLAEGGLNRSGLARRVCAQFGWANRAGEPKLMSCRLALLRTERAGLLRLPPPQSRNGNGRLHRPPWERALGDVPVTAPVQEVPELPL